MSTLVEMKGVVKKFPGVTALKDISFDIQAGEVHVLLGENGAGKSTLMKILSGVYQPTEGKIIIGGKEFSKLTPKDSYDNGISVIYQELSVINELSIQENLFVGKLPMKKIGLASVVDYGEMNRKAKELLAKIGLNRDPKTLVEDISVSEKQQVEIAKALASDSKVIVMDEPTASLTNKEVEHLFDVVRALKKEGKGIVFISHKLAEIKEIGDRVSVLKDGAYVGTKQVSDVSVDDLVTMMVGRTVQNTYQHEDAPDNYDGEEVIFEVKNLSRKDGKVKDVSFKLHKGEIVGFSGLVGSGRSEMMNSIFGAEPKSSGEVFIDGKKVNIKSPYSAIKHGLAMVTENRRETGFFHNFDIKQNISILPFIKSSSLGGAGGLISSKFEKECAEAQKKSLNIKCYSVDQGITELSGGNQQKVLLARWIATRPRLIILDEPTRGIDVGAKKEVEDLIKEIADTGISVLLISSELSELVRGCDRIFVLRDGTVRGMLNRDEISEENIMKWIANSPA